MGLVERLEEPAARLAHLDDVGPAVQNDSRVRLRGAQRCLLDACGELVFMDLLRKRAGKWVIVRTLSARVTREGGRSLGLFGESPAEGVGLACRSGRVRGKAHSSFRLAGQQDRT